MKKSILGLSALMLICLTLGANDDKVATDSSLVTFKLPKTMPGKELNSSEGSTFLVDGKKVWELARTWPASPMLAENYQPLVWKNNMWISTENSFGGQPSIRIVNNSAILSGRGAWGSTSPSSKLPALIFHCNEAGVYSISADINYNTWEGNGAEGGMLILKESNSEISEITRLETEGKKGTLTLDVKDVNLADADKVIITLKFKPYSGTNYSVKNLTITKGSAE